MPAIIEAYVVFAVATSISSCIFLFWPLLKKAKQDGIVNEFTEYSIMSVLIYTCIATVFAPVLFLILMYAPAGYSYMRGLERVLREQKS